MSPLAGSGRLRAAIHLTLFVALLVVGFVCAQAAGRGEAGPIYVTRVELGDPEADLAQLHLLDMDIDAVFHGWARVYAVPEEIDKLRLLGFQVSVVGIDGLLPSHSGEGAKESAPTQYHTYASLTADLQQIAADHPAITRLISIGQSVQGRELWMMKISDNPDIEEDEPEVAYISSMHGDEVVGKELCYNLIDYLTDNYGSDPRTTDLVDDHEIWIMPSMNPDGTELTRRYNANWIDLNRDFPDQFVDPVNSPNGRAAETQAVMNWRVGRNIVLSANFHGGALVANYPFDSNPQGTSVYSAAPDDNVLVSLSRTYADNNTPMASSNSAPSFNNGITNGADWYAINGGMQDWHYVWYGGLDLTLEVSNAKWPPANSLPAYWNDNLESMLSYLERAGEGLRGIVTDADTGLPLAATIYISGNDFPSFTDPDVGDYQRPLMAGLYTVEISATGYSPAVFDGIRVESGPATRLDVSLRPLGASLEPHGACFEGVSGCDAWLPAGGGGDLAVTLRNLGVAASAIEGVLVPAGWFGSVSREHATYPDLIPDQTGTSDAPHHEVQIDPSAPPGHKVGFAVRWTSDQGNGLSEPFFLPVGPSSCVAEPSTDTPWPILDRQTALSALQVTDDLELTSVEVTVDVSHGYKGDLKLTLVSPAGTRVQLHNRSGGSADDVVGTYGVDLTPFEPFERLHGESTSGTWTLEANDGVPGNTGTLNAWTLNVCGRPFEAAAPEMRLREVVRGTGGVELRWWPYPGMQSYRVYRSTDPSLAAAFADVTAEDDDSSDTVFLDTSAEPLLYWLVTAVGPNGEGPDGHFDDESLSGSTPTVRARPPDGPGPCGALPYDGRMALRLERRCDSAGAAEEGVASDAVRHGPRFRRR